jgi:metalloendopeptidase OMA1, mitochondrial
MNYFIDQAGRKSRNDPHLVQRGSVSGGERARAGPLPNKICPGRHQPLHLVRRVIPLVIIFAVGCASVPHTGRRQFNVLPDDKLNSLGTQAFKEMLSKERELPDKRINEIVGRVAERVSRAAEEIDKPRFKWEVRVIDNELPNAVCLPPGKILVFKGILPYAKNEAGLAAIIAHEVAHAVARHAGERISQQLALRGIASAGGELLKNKDGTMDNKSRIILGAFGVGGTLGLLLPYSRTHEFEADRIGQIYMARAGYDPAESVRLWERMEKIKKPPVPLWLSTHPPDEERITDLKRYLREAQKYYADAPVKYGLGTPL